MTEYTYRLIANSDSIFRSDGACITAGESNRDYREYLEWVAAGNTPEPADSAD